jgi:hypothetical protein
MTEPLDGCPTLEEIAALAEGRLRGEERDRLVGHLAGCEECREVLAATAGVLEDSVAVPSDRIAAVSPLRRRPWLPFAMAAASAALVLGTLTVYQRTAPPRLPSHAEWVAKAPPAVDLVPNLWGGVVLRGNEETGELSPRSAELGALLADLEIALTAADGERASELTDRISRILEDAGGLDREVADLALAARLEGDERLNALGRALPAIDRIARERFLTFYLDLGTFAERARLAEMAGDTRFVSSGSARRYLERVLRQRREPLSSGARSALQQLRDAEGSPSRALAASALLRSITAGG